ncbi:MAG: hypothetical protein MUO63_17780 [Desulfobulbaceae bacterium]|nr:hypothetical protein [Desulfobulbaceae bacterium]
MLAKKYLLWAGGGAVAVSIAVAITVNVIINSNDGNTKQLTCAELQQEIDKLGQPKFSNLPESIKNQIKVTGNDCSLSGSDWTLNNGLISYPNEKAKKWKDMIGAEKAPNMNDGDNILDDKFGSK